MLITNTEVYGFRRALHGMRAPRRSWPKADTKFFGQEDWPGVYRWPGIVCLEQPYIGPEDMKLAKKLIKAWGGHQKFLRHIVVWVDFELPLYLWSELDTYHGDIDDRMPPVRDSCSTVYDMKYKLLTAEDFEGGEVSPSTLAELNELHDKLVTEHGMLRQGDPAETIRKMKARLPSSYLLESTYSLNYETCINMYRQRKNHILPEWSKAGGICEWILKLPYLKEMANL